MHYNKYQISKIYA